MSTLIGAKVSESATELVQAPMNQPDKFTYLIEVIWGYVLLEPLNVSIHVTQHILVQVWGLIIAQEHSLVSQPMIVNLQAAQKPCFSCLPIS